MCQSQDDILEFIKLLDGYLRRNSRGIKKQHYLSPKSSEERAARAALRSGVDCRLRGSWRPLGDLL